MSQFVETKELMKILKEVDPNMSDRMRCHYKKQVVAKDGLIFKLLLEISEKNEIIEERDMEIACFQRARKI